MNKDHIWEIDKLCIYKNHQRQGYFQNFIHMIFYHATENRVKYYLALIEHKLYRMLKIILGSLIEQKGSLITGSTTSLIPVVLHIEKVVNGQEKTSKLLERVN